METRKQKDPIIAKMDEHFTRADKRLDESVRGIYTKMDQLRVDLKEDIKNDLLPKIEANEVNIAETIDRVEELETTVEQLQNSLELQTKTLELVVRGVPMVTNERCQQLYRKMASAVGYNPDSIPIADAFRLGRRSGALPNMRAPPILLRFTHKNDKTSFHNKYFAKKDLNLVDLGFPGASSRVYVSENLTTRNKQLFEAAMQLRKDGKLSTVSTFHGIVSVKMTRDGNPIKILKEADLDAVKNQ
jgi:hypothetical protein